MSVSEICCLDCAGKVDRCDDCAVVVCSRQSTQERAFTLLTQNQDLWDAVCWSCSGNSLLNMAGIRLLRAPTLSSPAYRLLAGRDIDHCLVPWCDFANILGDCANIRGLFPAAARGGRDNMLRHMSAVQAVDAHERNIPMAPTWRGYYTCGGPARPSSPLIAAASPYLEPPFVYTLPNPCDDNWRVPDLAPPVFPPDEHHRAYLAYINRLNANTDDSESDSSTSASSWHGASSWR